MGTKLGWGQGRGYLLSGSSPAWNLQGEKEQSLHQGASGSCLALPHPTAGKCPLHCPQGGSWSFLRPHSGEQWMGFRPGAQGLTSQGQPENRAVISLPATKPLSTPDPSPPTHSHTCTGVVQDQPKRLWQGQKLLPSPGGRHGQKRPEPLGATCETQPHRRTSW